MVLVVMGLLQEILDCQGKFNVPLCLSWRTSRKGSSAEAAANSISFFLLPRHPARKVRSHLYIALDMDYIDSQRFEAVHSLAEEVSRIVGGLRALVARQRDE
jgi:hypothetical protein